MNNIWIIGECILDRFYKVDQLPRHGGSSYVDRLEEYLGGSAVNIALILSSLCLTPILVTYFGSNISKRMQNRIHKTKNLRVLLLESTHGISSENNIYYSDTEYYSFFRTGSENNINHANFLLIENIRNGDIVIFAGGHYRSFRNLYKKTALSKQISLIFNPSYAIYRYEVKTLTRLLTHANYFFLNSDEDKYLYTDIGMNISQLARKKKTVVVTLGPRGVKILTLKGKSLIKGIQVKKIENTIGAGDGLISGFIYGLTNELNLQTCIEIGQVCASFVLENTCAHANITEQMIYKRYKEWLKKDIGSLISSRVDNV